MARRHGVKAVARYALGSALDLVVAQGSVVHFAVKSSPRAATAAAGGSDVDNDNDTTMTVEKIGAIVNAANEGCLGGGGVDGAISVAGGVNLADDRLALPLVVPKNGGGGRGRRGGGVRCPTGCAVVTGPNDYGELRVPYVVHAVGPNYYYYEEDEADELLISAYQQSMDCCRDAGIHQVAFSLLSAGAFRGGRSLKEILTLGISALRDWAEENENDTGVVESVTMCCFSDREARTLLQVCDNQLDFLDNGDEEEEEPEEEDDDNEDDNIVVEVDAPIAAATLITDSPNVVSQSQNTVLNPIATSSAMAAAAAASAATSKGNTSTPSSSDSSKERRRQEQEQEQQQKKPSGLQQTSMTNFFAVKTKTPGSK